MTREEEIKSQADIYVGHPQDLGEDIGITKMRNAFIEGAKWADKTMIERVLNFMFKYFYEHPHVNAHICTDSFESLEELEEELLKAMEE